MLCSGESKNPGWTGGKSILAEAGTLQMEFLYLARITEDPEFARQVQLHPPPFSLFFTNIDSYNCYR